MLILILNLNSKICCVASAGFSVSSDVMFSMSCNLIRFTKFSSMISTQDMVGLHEDAVTCIEFSQMTSNGWFYVV
jgi:hypothetical protein